MFDASLLRVVAGDLAKEVRAFDGNALPPLHGREPSLATVDVATLGDTLQRLATDPSVPLWHLQWMMVVLIYVSESFVAGLVDDTYASLMRPWYDGTKDMPPFETRFEQYICGQFKKKVAKGARKIVAQPALAPLDAVIRCVIDVHRMQAVGGRPSQR
jgi:hypothetical protein